MSIIKAIRKSGKTSKALSSVLNYVGEKGTEIKGINCSSDYKEAYKQFLETKQYYNKMNGRQYRHYIQSFSPKEVDSKRALEIGVDWAERSFPGFEVLIATHTDKDHIHNHFIINSVNFDNGMKLHESAKELQKRKELNDEIIQSYGLKKTEKQHKEGEITAWDTAKYKILVKGADITRLAEKCIEVIKESLSIKDFINKMSKSGYDTDWNENHKHVTFTVSKEILKGKKNKFRLTNLQKTFNKDIFSKDKLIEQFEINKAKEEEKKLTDIANKFRVEESESQDITNGKIDKLQKDKSKDLGIEI